MEGSLGGLLTSLVVVCRGHAWYPGFALGSSKVAVGFFGLFVYFAPNFAQLPMQAVIFSPIQFLSLFYFLLTLLHSAQ